MEFVKKNIIMPENILSRIELVDEGRVILLYNVLNKQVLKGNEDMLNIVLTIEQFDSIDKIMSELSNLYETENNSEFQKAIMDSFNYLVERGFAVFRGHC